MDIHHLSQLLNDLDRSRVRYQEFLRQPSLSVGVYTLPSGGIDPQQPHSEDEVYYVVSGRATITISAEERVVAPGDVVFVTARVPHHFHRITEDLTLLVFFAPAEGRQP